MTVLEKNSEEQIGGRLNELVMEGGFRFDTGPSLLLLPETYRETFRGQRGPRATAAVAAVAVSFDITGHYSVRLTTDQEYHRTPVARLALTARLSLTQPSDGTITMFKIS